MSYREMHGRREKALHDNCFLKNGVKIYITNLTVHHFMNFKCKIQWLLEHS